MAYQHLKLTIENKIAIITFHRPEALNALNSAVLNELDQIMDELTENPEVRVVIFTGEGKSFIAGADLDELGKAHGVGVMEYSRRGRDVFRKVELMPKPTIAAINGYAFGGGFEFLLCCDIRIAHKKALFAMPEATLGLVPGFNGTVRLPRTVGMAKAKELLFTGQRINAEEALKIGVLNQVTELENFWETVMEKAEVMAGNSPLAIRLIKAAVIAGADTSFDVAKEVEMGYMTAGFDSPDQIEGIAAFKEKRKPIFES